MPARAHNPDNPLPESTWTFRRAFTYGAVVLNDIGIGLVIWKLDDAPALKTLGLALIAVNVVLATLYLAGASVDYAQLLRAWKGQGR